MPDYLETARGAIEEQLRRLREEVARLERAAAALDSSAPRRGPARGRVGDKAARRSRGRQSASAGPRRGRRRASGRRAGQALKLVSHNPGISIKDLAAKMKIKPNYLYRVLPALEAGGKVRKQDGGWHAVA